MNKIVTQYGVEITDENLVECNMEKIESLTGTELSYDTVDLTVEENIYRAILLTRDNKVLVTSDGKLLIVDNSRSWKYGVYFRVYHNDILQGKFYVENVKRVGKTRYRITGISGAGILDNSQHYGGIYQGIMFDDLVAEIIGNQIPYSVDATVARQPVYGWLPIASRRDNLHQALFAMSASIKKDENGDMFITALSKDITKAIPDSRIFAGGSIDYPQAKKAIALSEHAYIARTTDEGITLYNSEIAADSITTPNGNIVLGGLVLFDEPCHDLQITGAEILESGVNYAVLSPTAECLLTGKRYTHTVRQVTRPEVIENVSDENKAIVANATLVSIANSEAVANRLADFYGSAKTVKMDILQTDETAGDAVTFNDPFNEETEGLITKLDMRFSGILRATAEIVADYDPPDIGNYYDNVIILTGTQYFDIPQDTEKVRVILIGGGQAGHKGEDGETAWHNSWDKTEGNPGEGGQGGAGGKGGNIFIFTLETTNGGRINASCGVGGTGGDAQNGTPTTVVYNGNTYTSADGTTSSMGFIEIFSGNSYGYPSADNNTKAGGGGNLWGGAQKGEDYTDTNGTWYGGAGGSRYEVASYWNSGGGGGGAAHGSNGGDGGDGTAGTHGGYGHVGAGGAGANGDNGANATAYGCGGGGGYGGGGGGEAGVGYRRRKTTSGEEYDVYVRGNDGVGGTGGLGGNGADGCVIIYY